MKFKKAFLTKGKHKIEIENFGNVYVIWEYNKDLLKSNLELKEWEIEDFIKGWEKEGYHFTIVKGD